MEQWKDNIKNLFEALDQENTVSKKELQSKWRIVEEGISEKKAKPFWIISAGVAAGLLLVIGIVFFNRSKNTRTNWVKVQNGKTKVVEQKPQNEIRSTFQSPVLLSAKSIRITDSNSLGLHSPEKEERTVQDSFFSHSIPPVLLSAAEKTTNKKSFTRSRQKSRKSIALHGSSITESNLMVKQKTGINMMDYVDLTEKGRHEDEKREDKNTIIKF